MDDDGVDFSWRQWTMIILTNEVFFRFFRDFFKLKTFCGQLRMLPVGFKPKNTYYTRSNHFATTGILSYIAPTVVHVRSNLLPPFALGTRTSSTSIS